MEIARIDSDFYGHLLDSLSDGVYFMDSKRTILYWNRGAERITGFKKHEVVGTACRENVLMHVDDQGRRLCQTEFCPAHATVMDGTERQVEVFLRHKKGYRLPVSARIAPIREPNGKIAGVVEVFTDNRRVQELTGRIKDLERLALVDPLTGIGNRRYAKAQLEASLQHMSRYGWDFGFFFIDVDHFKQINDKYGHENGDKVLQMVSRTLVHSLRSSDTTGRWGGEEFVAIIPHLGTRDLVMIGQKLCSLIEQSGLSTVNGELKVTVSIGATRARRDDTEDSIVQRADGLMYFSKTKGRNTCSTDDRSTAVVNPQLVHCTNCADGDNKTRIQTGS